ncbi:tRNA (adenosine(37)-N6)-threonylcarbamoyltransferase complex dimerization subunit type 1 TsaB [Maricaulis salignorans]|uniref:tRNA threonylcarbamoyladenosine biosynthesis protein TsaB n=1 Tax=Maricaulis salignorans TaxID=144026 RepID=A0A1G9V394_9PROT|nr:tRNA (adenosine(37)-N6)-threonylcarbamoyltransferase complex dimerization subunit type 1 TsaB [Maricaulis salignorans]SDM66608.1 tRNA threonylcarbamoyladenosine biosynthesis protein TsaB [Maricaulis salignorans]
MALLAIDTTGSDCSVALRVAGQPDLCRSDPIGRGHAEYLAPMIAGMLEEAGLQAAQLTRIGVMTGPGSFAGSRVGVAFARGLALATGAQAVGIGNLAVLAQAAGISGPLAVLHDAKRGDVILQVWTGGVATSAELLPVAEVAARIRELAGDAGHLAGSGAALIDLPQFTDLALTTIDLPALLDLAEAADAAQAPPLPFYARPPDAKLPGGRQP